MLLLVRVGMDLATAQPLPLPEVDLPSDVTDVVNAYDATPTADARDAVLDRLKTSHRACADADPLTDRGLAACVATVRLAVALVGPDDASMAELLLPIAQWLDTSGRWSEAEPLFRRALAIAEATPDHPDVGLYLNELAIGLERQGHFAEAERRYRRAIAEAERAHGPAHPDVATRLSNLGTLLVGLGQFEEAEALLRRAVAIDEAILDPDDPGLGPSLTGLGDVLASQGQLREAEALYRRALGIAERSFGPDHPITATALGNLALVLDATGRFDEAETLYRRALAIDEATLGDRHPALVTSLGNLAGLLQHLDRSAEAEPLLVRAVAIAEANPDHPHALAGALGNLAVLLFERGRLADAEVEARRAWELSRSTLGPDHPDVAFDVLMLAQIAEETRNLEAAETGYRRAIAILEAAWGPAHRSLIPPLTGLQTVLETRGDLETADRVFERWLALEHADLRRGALLGSPSDQRARLPQFRASLEYVMSRHLEERPNDPEAARVALHTWLQRKGLLGAVEQRILATARYRNDGTTLELLDALKAATARRAARWTAGAGDDEAAWQRELEMASAQQASLQRQIASRAAIPGQGWGSFELADVAAQLPRDAQLIEFVSYQPTRTDGERGAARYAAYALAPDAAVSFADLGPAAPIDGLVADLRAAIIRQQRVAPLARELLTATLGTLDLDGTTQLFLSTDGTLSLVPFELVIAFGDPPAPTISYLGSGRELLPASLRDVPPPTDAVVVYDVDYGAGPSADLDRWRPLPHTHREGRAVRRALRPARQLTGDRATESALRTLERPRVLHVASHGTIDATSVPPRLGATRDIRRLENPRPRTLQTDHPMLRSAIVLAGANRPTEDRDGLFTAGELATIDLRGTQLVTLSACRTGEGELRNGDGVYGLRRALMLAGSRSQVLSLWSVDDEATASLMREFYRRLRDGWAVGRALDAARQAVREEPRWAHPYYWAAFTLSGDPTVVLDHRAAD